MATADAIIQVKKQHEYNGEYKGDYEYKVIDGNIEVKDKKIKVFSTAIEGILNKYSVDGWEFYSADNLCEIIPPGCIGALFFKEVEYKYHQCFIFRRKIKRN